MATADNIQQLDKLIQDKIPGTLLEQHVTNLLPPGENYGSCMYKVDFKVDLDGVVKDYHAVAKCTPINEMIQEFFNTQQTFKSEIAWYTTIIPTLKSLAKKYGMKRELDFFQELYGARISLDATSEKVDLDGVILTENLKTRGYSNIDRHLGFDRPTTLSILNDIAAFHATTVAIRQKNPEIFDRVLKGNSVSFGVVDGPQKETMDNERLKMFKNVVELQQYHDRVAKHLEQAFPFKQRELRDPWIGILHLDLWCNNIMVTGGENSKNILLDLQVPMVASPPADIVFFLMTSVSFDEIVENIDWYFQYYHKKFIGYLKEMSVDVEKFDYNSFLNEIDVACRGAEISHILGHISIIFQDKGEGIDTSDNSVTPETIENMTVKYNAKQIERTKWAVQEAIKRNWI